MSSLINAFVADARESGCSSVDRDRVGRAGVRNCDLFGPTAIRLISRFQAFCNHLARSSLRAGSRRWILFLWLRNQFSYIVMETSFRVSGATLHPSQHRPEIHPNYRGVVSAAVIREPGLIYVDRPPGLRVRGAW